MEHPEGPSQKSSNKLTKHKPFGSQEIIFQKDPKGPGDLILSVVVFFEPGEAYHPWSPRGASNL